MLKYYSRPLIIFINLLKGYYTYMSATKIPLKKSLEIKADGVTPPPHI